MTNGPHQAQRQQLLSAAHAKMQRGQLDEAEQMLLALLGYQKDDREALEWLVEIYLQAAIPEKAEGSLRQLLTLYPETPEYWLRLADLLEGRGRLTESADCYRDLIRRVPDLAVARFNFACFLRRRGQLEEALREHLKALDLDLAHPEEALCNIAVIYTELRRDENAQAFLHQALAINPAYLPAMYNLALRHEEFGDMDAALDLFGRILALDPTYYNALIRMAHAQTIKDPADIVVKKLRRALRRSNLDPLERESLHFAMGKALDDCHLYDDAFVHYRMGNRCSASRVRSYDGNEEEDRVEQIVQTFSSDWLGGVEPVSERPLIFVSGMFRSGSTMFEQVLAAHPRVTAGGEIDYFSRWLTRSAAPFPASFTQINPEEYRRLGTDYLEYLDKTFSPAALVTNKCPDAFVQWGLLKALFPNARFVNTVRDPLDTCLSIYFQQLDDRFAYASDLENIAHYYCQYVRLMNHWKQLFGSSIFDAVYDDFVLDPERTTKSLLRFLGLEWHEGCLNFQRRGDRVRTASVWQVRRAVYRTSSGRWRNYEQHLEPLRRLLAPESAAS